MSRYRNGKCPGPEGVAWFLRCPLTGHISKNHDKGSYGMNAPLLGIQAEANELKKIAKRFFTDYGGVTGAQAPVERGSGKAGGFEAWGDTSPLCFS
jgi:hypothetical protein